MRDGHEIHAARMRLRNLRNLLAAINRLRIPRHEKQQRRPAVWRGATQDRDLVKYPQRELAKRRLQAANGGAR